jgi:peroxiredoxin
MARSPFSPTATAISHARSGFRSISPRVGSAPRSQRYAMIVDNGVVRRLNVEAAPGKIEMSSAETLLQQF